MRHFKYSWLLLLLAAACRQGEGDLCQENRDCQAGLICDGQQGSIERGTCRVMAQSSMSQTDAATEPPLPGEDAGEEDSGVEPMDAGPSAQPMSDAGANGDAAVGAEPVPDAGSGMDAG